MNEFWLRLSGKREKGMFYVAEYTYESRPKSIQICINKSVSKALLFVVPIIVPVFRYTPAMVGLGNKRRKNDEC